MYSQQVLTGFKEPTGVFFVTVGRALDAAGNAVGAALDWMGRWRPARWDLVTGAGSVPMQIVSHPGFKGYATGVSEAGWTCGIWSSADSTGSGLPCKSTWQPFVVNGNAQDLTTVFGGAAECRAMNEAGKVLVAAQDHGFLYDVGAAVTTPFPLGDAPGFAEYCPRAIAADGRVAGTLGPAISHEGFVHDGQFRSLGPVEAVTGVNSAGIVVGSRHVAADRVVGFLCDTTGRTPVFEDIPPHPTNPNPDLSSEVDAINEAGDVVGAYFLSGLPGGEAFVKFAGEPVQLLGSLLYHPTGVQVLSAHAIDKNRTILCEVLKNGLARTLRLRVGHDGPSPHGHEFEAAHDLPILVATILVGVAPGGSGIVFVPGRGPVPVDPAPFYSRWATLDAETRDALTALAIRELAANIGSRELRARIESVALTSAIDALARLKAAREGGPE